MRKLKLFKAVIPTSKMIYIAPVVFANLYPDEWLQVFTDMFAENTIKPDVLQLKKEIEKGTDYPAKEIKICYTVKNQTCLLHCNLD